MSTGSATTLQLDRAHNRRRRAGDDPAGATYSVSRISARWRCDMRTRRGQGAGLVRIVEGTLRLFRTGDAVAHRNIHAGTYDARRLALAL
jgi:hypothetical protein